MANNVNNGITGVIDIPGALRSRGAADGNLVGGVVAYSGDIYDVTAGKNLATLNAEFASGIANAGISDVQVKSSSASNYTTIVASGIAKIDLSGFVSQADGGGTALTTSEHRSGSYSEAISLPRAIGLGSVSSGDDCIAFGKASTAIGCNTIAIGDNSFVAGRNSFNYSEFAVFNQATYLQDGYIGIAWAGPYEITRGMVMVFRDENYLISEYEPITNVEYGPYDGANTSWSGRDCLKLYYDTSHTIDVPTYLEVSTASLGRNSIGLGYSTVAANEGEVAVGCCNITHGGLTNAEKTMFSVGIGVDKILDNTLDNVFRNAFEVMWDGSIYVKGVGGYDGYELTGKTDLATVITNVSTRLTTLESSSSSSSGGISQSPQSGTNLSPNRTSTSFNQSTNHDKLVPAELTTHLGQDSVCSGKDTYSTGVSSFASGDNVLAKGDNSAAFGEGSFAFGDGSVSVGVNDVMPCYIYVSEDSSYTGGSPRRYNVTIQPTLSLLNYDNKEVLDNMMIAIMPNHTNNVIDGIVYAQLFDVYFDVDAFDNRFDQYMHAKVYISDEDRLVSYTNDYEQEATHTIGESDNAYYGLLCRSANGKSSATIGKNLMTSNEGEVAVGNSNVSHKKQTNLAGTIFSVGARGLVSKAERSNTDYDEWALDEDYDPAHEDATTIANVNAFFNTADCSSPSNALEVLDDGKVFIRGIGGFNGLNSTTSGVKSVQQVIEELTLQIAALTNN